MERGHGRKHRKQKPQATWANNAKKSESVYALTDKKRERQKERESWRGSKRGQSESKRELVACASAPLADAFTVAYFQGVRSLCASERERERGESLP